MPAPAWAALKYNRKQQNTVYLPIKRVWKTMLAAGTAACGLFIMVAGWELEAGLNGPFRANLTAMEKTVRELDHTIKKLGEDVGRFDSYLGEVQKQLLAIHGSMGVMNDQASGLVKLAGDSSQKILVNASKSLNDAGHTLRVTANQAGKIPLDPLAAQRSDMYSIAGTLESTSGTLKATAEPLMKMTNDFGDATKAMVAEAQKTIHATAGQIGVLQNGSLRQLPQILSAASDQMRAHLEMLRASSDLIVLCCVPVIALGLGLLLVGLRGIIPEGRVKSAAN